MIFSAREQDFDRMSDISRPTRPTARCKMIMPREADHEYDVDHRGDLFYIRTNKGAKNFRVVTAPVSNPAETNWKELVAHRPAVKVDDIDLFADHLVLSEWENGLQQIEIIDFKTNKRHRIEFPEPVYSASASDRTREFNTSVVRYNYQSLVTPSSVFDYDMNTQQGDAAERDRSARRLRQEELQV